MYRHILFCGLNTNQQRCFCKFFIIYTDVGRRHYSKYDFGSQIFGCFIVLQTTTDDKFGLITTFVYPIQTDSPGLGWLCFRLNCCAPNRPRINTETCRVWSFQLVLFGLDSRRTRFLTDENTFPYMRFWWSTTFSIFRFMSRTMRIHCDHTRWNRNEPYSVQTTTD